MLAEEWKLRAACRSVDPDVFFTEDRASQDEAKLFCLSRCSVRLDCLAFAMENHIEHGIYGGLRDTERRSLLKNLGRPGVRELYGRNRNDHQQETAHLPS